jgi:hypothetical protein
MIECYANMVLAADVDHVTARVGAWGPYASCPCGHRACLPKPRSPVVVGQLAHQQQLLSANGERIS